MSHKRRLLRRRGHVFYYRQRVPQALVALLGRAEVQWSLRTADPREAARRAAVMEVGLGRRWAALAMRGDAMRLEQHEVEQLAEEYFVRLVREDREQQAAWRPSGFVPDGAPDELDPAEWEFDETVFQYWSELEDERERMLHGDRRSVKEDVEQVAAARGLDDETRERLSYAFQLARMRYLRARAAELEEDVAGKPRTLVLADGAANTAGSVSSAKKITEAVQEWMHAEGPKWKTKTQNETKRALGWFMQVVGDVSLDRVKPEHVTRFKATLERVPRGTSAKADIRAYAGADLPPPEQRLDRATVTKALGRVSAFFAWTVHPQHWIERSPAAGALRKGKKRGREARALRDSFEKEELAQIFGADFAQWQHERPARFWVPLLALYTGARLSELAQLLVKDVYEVEDGALVLDFNDDGDGKSLKTEASRRRVPVHKQVIELGFAEFVEARRAERAHRLFHDVSPGANGFGGPLSTWFGRWLEEHEVKNKKKVFHSMRHTVRDALSRAGVLPHVVNALQGWENQGMAFGQYGSEPGRDELREAVERLDWREPLAALFERCRG